MNVQELHAKLSELLEGGFGELPVLLSSDPEGNSYMESHQIAGPRIYEGHYYFEPVYDWDTDEPVTEIPENDGSIPYVKAVTIWP